MNWGAKTFSSVQKPNSFCSLGFRGGRSNTPLDQRCPTSVPYDRASPRSSLVPLLTLFPHPAMSGSSPHSVHSSEASPLPAPHLLSSAPVSQSAMIALTPVRTCLSGGSSLTAAGRGAGTEFHRVNEREEGVLWDGGVLPAVNPLHCQRLG